MAQPKISRKKEIDQQIQKLRDEKASIDRASRKRPSTFDSEKLKAERLACGFTSCLSFARAIKDQGMPKASPALACYWERGVVPSSRYLMVISKVLNRPIDYFFTK